MQLGDQLVRISRALCTRVAALRFGAPVRFTYNPLDYAFESHEMYLRRWGCCRARALLVGMNPGPFGMVQTGVPFGDVTMVRDWLGIEARVRKPATEHPKRPVRGFACARSEVSGTRLWGWARATFEQPERFFQHFFVWNYCPLAFLEESGRNRTPDKLTASERRELFDACDEALCAAFDTLRPQWVIGIGRFASDRIRSALLKRDYHFGTISHPSPANPKANRGWAALVDSELKALGVQPTGAPQPLRK